MSKSCSWNQLMDNPTRPWEQSLASASQSERSAFIVKVQVVKEASFECLLGLPFMCLALTKCQEFLDGSAHLLLTDPCLIFPLPCLALSSMPCLSPLSTPHPIPLSSLHLTSSPTPCLAPSSTPHHK